MSGLVEAGKSCEAGLDLLVVALVTVGGLVGVARVWMLSPILHAVVGHIRMGVMFI